MTHEIKPLIPVPRLTEADMERIYKKLMEEKPKPVANVQKGFYRINLQLILQSTSSSYRIFLRDAGYGDLDACLYLSIAKNMLRIDQDVRDAAARCGITLTDKDNYYVSDISQTNARKLVESMGYKLLTTALMYRLFIPYIKDLAQQGNLEAKKTLDEMVNTKAEWLEDLILDKNKVKIGSREEEIFLTQTDGRFDRTDINQFGYPVVVKDRIGEFSYSSPKAGEMAANRGGSLGLGICGKPSLKYNWLGVRLAKIKEKKCDREIF
ncbi:hypothetical protein HYX19_01650 [Candidatus Woesearchaeota archaeon]|nr:hypothetical protein [Candidatus Woesearchaeota archaeon]